MDNAVRSVTAFCLLVLVATTAACRAAPVEGSATRPNILVLVADDAAWRTYGAYGDPVARTPNIDGLADRGLLFEQAILTTPQCSPSRISILTGRYPHSVKAEDLHMDLAAGYRIVPDYLGEAGYFTGNIRKAHFGPAAQSQFDWYGEDFGDFAAFLDAEPDRPFFMWVGFNDPHRVYESGAVSPPQDPEEITPAPHLRNTAATRADLALYYEEVARLDSDIGRLLEVLEARGLREETLVVFLSDNGAPFPREKGSLYDAGIATPLIVRWPGVIDPGSRYERLVSAIDLAPTFLDLAGVGIPDELPGKSLRAVLEGSAAPLREYAFSERNWHNCDEHQRSVRTERYKLIRNAYLDLPACIAADIGRSPAFGDLYEAKRTDELTEIQSLFFEVPRPEFELYDLEADPDEYRNIAGLPSAADTLAHLQDALAAWIEETDDVSPERRRRGPNTDRWTGIKFQRAIEPMVE